MSVMSLDKDQLADGATRTDNLYDLRLDLRFLGHFYSSYETILNILRKMLINFHA